MSVCRSTRKRSTAGCITCKRRKKKCDEARPYCRRCQLGDFQCLGYDDSDKYCLALEEFNDAQVSLFCHLSETPAVQSGHGPSPQSFDSLVALPQYTNQIGQLSSNHILLQEVRNYVCNIPKSILLDTVTTEDTTSLILSQYSKLTRELMFKSPPRSIDDGLLWRIDNSSITLWSMYLVARTVTDIANGGGAQKYLSWIFRFCQQILETSPDIQESDLEARLAGLYDLLPLVSAISGTASGYALLKRCAPVFLQSIACHPNLWSNDYAISISEAILNTRYEIAQFVIQDTVAALVLGTPPLLCYDSTPIWTAEVPFYYQIMHGFPVEILLFLAKANDWRASQSIGQMPCNQSESIGLEEQMDSWDPNIDYTDGPDSNIARFAIQEAWRQAAKIYLYMGVKGANSADPQVESAVRQVVRLESVLKGSNPQKLHLLVPCLLAGVAARQEEHRAVLRNRVSDQRPSKINVLVLRGPDFALILDHLWHGVGSQGNPVTWEDYVQSRSRVLPV